MPLTLVEPTFVFLVIRQTFSRIVLFSNSPTLAAFLPARPFFWGLRLQSCKYSVLTVSPVQRVASVDSSLSVPSCLLPFASLFSRPALLALPFLGEPCSALPYCTLPYPGRACPVLPVVRVCTVCTEYCLYCPYRTEYSLRWLAFLAGLPFSFFSCLAGCIHPPYPLQFPPTPSLHQRPFHLSIEFIPVGSDWIPANSPHANAAGLSHRN